MVYWIKKLLTKGEQIFPVSIKMYSTDSFLFPFSPDCKQDKTNELNVVTYYSQYFYFQKTLESIQSDNGLMLTIVVEETYIQ